MFIGFALILFTSSCQKSTTIEPGNLEPVVLSIDFSSITSSSIRSTWTRYDGPNFLKYDIHYSRTPNLVPADTNRYTTFTVRETTQTTVTNLLSNTTYYFKIRVFVQDGRFADSNEPSATTAPPGPVPVLYTATIRFVHTARTLPTVAVRVDATIRDTISFEAASAYRVYPAGTRLIALLDNGSVLESEPVAFTVDAKATVFILDKPSGSSRRFSFLSERYIFQQPTLPDSALLRFVNASLGLDTASLHVGSPGGIMIGSRVPFGKASPYGSWQPGAMSLFLTRHNDTTVIGTPTVISFSANRRYTIVALDSMPAPRLKFFIDD